jgi:hypothetical protein
VREVLTDFVARQVGPRDLVAVLKPLDSLLDIRLTRDRQAIARAIAAFEGRMGEYRARNPFEEALFAADPERIEGLRPPWGRSQPTWDAWAARARPSSWSAGVSRAASAVAETS